MAEGTVDVIINKPAIDTQFDYVVKKLDAIMAKIAEANAAARGLETGSGGASAPGGGTAPAPGPTGRGKQQATEMERLQKRLNDLNAAGAVEVAKLREQIRQQMLALRAQSQETLNAEGSLNKLRAQLILAQRAYDTMSEKLRNTEAGKAAKKTVDDLTASVKALEEGTGRHQRSVGDYAKAYDGLNAQLQGLLREVPSAQSLNQFFLAASNQLPQFFDEIGRATQQMQAFKEAVEEANVAQAAASQVAEAASGVAKSTEEAFADQTDSVVDQITASHEQAVALKEQIAEQIAAAEAGNISTAEAAANTEAMLINAGATVEDAAAIGANTVATIEASSARAAATATLEAQTIATNAATAAAVGNTSVGGRLLRSLFSINSLLTVGVLLLTAYGAAAAEGIGNMIKSASSAEKKVDAAKLSQDRYTEAVKRSKKAVDEYTKSVQSIDDGATSGAFKQIAELKALALVAQDVTQSTQNRKQAIDQLQEQYPAYFANLSKERLLNGDIADEIERATNALIAKAYATAAQEKFAEVMKKIYELDKASLEIQKQSDAYRGKRLDSEYARLQTQRQQTEDELTKARKDRDEFVADIQKYSNEAGGILFKAPPKPGRNKDLEAMENLIQRIRDEWAALQRAFTVRGPNDEKEMPFVLPDANLYQKRMTELANRLRGVEEAYVEDLIAVELKYQQGGYKTIEEYEKAKTDLVASSTQARLKATVDAYRAARNDENLTFDERQDLEKKLADAELAMIDATNAAKIKKEKDTQDKLKAERERAAELSQQLAMEAFKTLGTLADASTQRELGRLEKESQALTYKYDQERVKIENSLLTAEERQRALLGLNAQEQAEQNRLAIEREKQEKEQSNRRKQLALFEIAINTATAVSKQLAQTPLPAGAGFVAAILAIGAAQAIAASAAQYAEGTDNHPGGAAIMGEEGTELVIEKSGKKWLTPNKATFYENLSAGAKVIPHDKVVEMAAIAQAYGMPSMQSLPSMDNRRLDKLISATEKQTRVLSEAIGNQRGVNMPIPQQWNNYLSDLYI